MKTSTILIIILIIIIVAFAGYYFYTANQVIERDDPIPMGDALDNMDEKGMEEFNKAVEEMSGIIVIKNEAMPRMMESMTTFSGIFKPRAHSVEGNVKVIEHSGEKILRFEDFETINGPNLHIYLSKDTGASDFIDLGKMKATRGNINYELPEGVDLEKYNKVLVWCVPFRVLFSYAELK